MYMPFFCSELILITLIKQTNNTFVNLRAAFVCFILSDTSLSLKVFSSFEYVVLIGWRCYCYQLTGLISSFFISLVKIGRISVTLGFSSQTRKKAFLDFLSESYQRKKIEQLNTQMCTHKAVLCYSYTIMFF